MCFFTPNLLLTLQTQNPFPGGPFEQKNLVASGTASGLWNQVIPFKFIYNVRTVGTRQAGYTWELSDIPASLSSPVATLDFTTGDAGIGGAAFSDPHNAILIGLSARFPTSAADIGSSSAVLTDATFEITESLDPFILCGSTTIPTTRVATTNGVADLMDGSQKSLWIVADRDLSRTSWQLTGNIRLTSTNTAARDDELVKFFINVKETGPVTAKDIVERCPETCGEPMMKRVPADIDAVSSEPNCFVCVWYMTNNVWGGG
jgi:hypothetical protein